MPCGKGEKKRTTRDPISAYPPHSTRARHDNDSLSVRPCAHNRSPPGNAPMEPVADFYDNTSSQAAAAIGSVFAVLSGIYWITTELLDAPVWLAVLLDVVVFVTLFSIWVRRANAAIRAEEAQARAAALTDAKKTGGKASDKKRD